MSINKRQWRGILLAVTILMISSDWLFQPATAYHFPCGVDVGQRLVFRSYYKANETALAIENYEGYVISSIEDANGTLWGEPTDYTIVFGTSYLMTASAYASNPDQLFSNASLRFPPADIVGELHKFHHLGFPLLIPSDRKVSEMEQRYNVLMPGANFTVTFIEDGRGVLISFLPLECNRYGKYVYTCNGVLESMDVRGYYGLVNQLTLVSGDKWCPDYSFLIIIAIVAGVAVAACALNATIKRWKGRMSPKLTPVEPTPAPPAPHES
jgi:hypothetical protein